MNANTVLRRKARGYIKTPTLVLLALATVFFSRLVDTAGAPSFINFLHFATVPSVCVITLAKTKVSDRKQIAIIWAIISGLGLLLAVMLASAIFNDAGVINVILDFLLLGEPFLVILTLVSIPMSAASCQQLRIWVVRCGFFHSFLAFFQRYILQLHHLPGLEDNIQGIFYRSGAGHVVGASIALTFGMYYFISAKTVPIWIRVAVILMTLWHMLLADAKQVLLSFIFGGALLLVTKFKDIAEAVKYLCGAVVLGYGLIWCIQNLEAFRAFQTWIRPEIYGPDGEATLLKTSVFRIVPSFYESPLNWALGLGPGHTVGRLGGWMLSEYWSLVGPLGATIHPASGAVWAATGASWLGDQSSMFSPFFGWAGIWGDLGFLGLAAYLYLAFLIWRYVCIDDFCKFLLLTVFAFGLVFSQMEEPGYMLYIASIIGIRWQEYQSLKRDRKLLEQ